MTSPHPTETPFLVSGNRRRKKSNLPAFIFLGVIIATGVVITLLITVFDIDNKVDVPPYPGSEKGTLTAKGLSFIESKYTSDKPTSDYYKVRLTTDSCENVLNYYRTEAIRQGWTAETQNKTSGAKIVGDSYSKNAKGLAVYCAAPSEQLLQNDGGKNSIILATADSVLKLSY